VPEPSAEDDGQQQALATADGTAAGDTALATVDGPLAEYQRAVREIDEQLLLAAPDRCVHTQTFPRTSAHSFRRLVIRTPIYSLAFFCGLYVVG
jgi:hypothetical protein